MGPILVLKLRKKQDNQAFFQDKINEERQKRSGNILERIKLLSTYLCLELYDLSKKKSPSLIVGQAAIHYAMQWPRRRN